MTTHQPVEASDTRSHLEGIARTTVPDRLEALLARYDETVGRRDRFIWKWLYYLFPEIRLTCVRPTDADGVREAKLLASLYVVLLDDLAEIERDERTFRECAKIPFRHQVPDTTRQDIDDELVELAACVWEGVDDVLESGPRDDEFRDLLTFDLKQTLNAIEYSFLTNGNLELASVEESTRFGCHNMMLFTYVDIDLVHSPAFDREELGTLRKIVWRAQQMARIGNWVTTWERELGEGDFSSGVVVAALEDDVVSAEQLAGLREADAPERLEGVATRIREAEIEDRFLRRWADHRTEIEEHLSRLETVDVESFMDGMETVMECHLASRGFK